MQARQNGRVSLVLAEELQEEVLKIIHLFLEPADSVNISRYVSENRYDRDRKKICLNLLLTFSHKSFLLAIDRNSYRISL